MVQEMRMSFLQVNVLVSRTSIVVCSFVDRMERGLKTALDKEIMNHGNVAQACFPMLPN